MILFTFQADKFVFSKHENFGQNCCKLTLYEDLCNIKSPNITIFSYSYQEKLYSNNQKY